MKERTLEVLGHHRNLSKLTLRQISIGKLEGLINITVQDNECGCPSCGRSLRIDAKDAARIARFLLPRKGLFEAFKGHPGTVLVSATPPKLRTKRAKGKR